MASEKTLALRAAAPVQRTRILKAGPTVAELATAGAVSANRRNRMCIEAQLSRAQRDELRQKRHIRKWQGFDPPQPEWAKKAEGKYVDINGLMQHMQNVQAEEAKPLDEPESTDTTEKGTE